MPHVTIDDFDDPRLEPYRHLKLTNATRRAGLFVCEGDKLTERLLASTYEVHSVLVSRGWLPRLASLVPNDIPVLVIPDDWVEQLVGYNFHRGVLACGRRGPGASLDELAGRDGPLLLVVCPQVNDPENLGAILRIGDALGVHGVVLGSASVDPLSRRVLRVSMGSVLRMPLVRTDDVAALLKQLRDQHQAELWATVLDTDAQPLTETAVPQRLALLLGGEGHGLAREIVAQCDRRVTIPMQPGVDSLNVGVAAGIFLYHVARVNR